MCLSRTEKNLILDHSSFFLSPLLFPLSFYTLHMRYFFPANFLLNLAKSLNSMDLKNEHFGNVHCGLETNIFHKFLHLTQTPSSQFSQEHPYSSPVLLWIWGFLRLWWTTLPIYHLKGWLIHQWGSKNAAVKIMASQAKLPGLKISLLSFSNSVFLHKLHTSFLLYLFFYVILGFLHFLCKMWFLHLFLTL